MYSADSEVLEREVLQLPPHARHSEAVRQRRVQVARLLRDPLLLFLRKEIQRPHVVQPVRELDEDDSRVLGDREQKLSVVLDLPVLRRVERQVADLGQTIDDLGDFLPELGLDVVDADGGVFDDVVDQPAGDRYRIQLKVDENLGDFDAVRDEVLARQALLPHVRAFAEAIGAREQLLVEALRERLAIVVPARNDHLRFDRRHNSPASAKLR